MKGEEGTFRSKLFGGFNRQDVVSYIEKNAVKNNELKEENEKLKEDINDLEEKIAQLNELLNEKSLELQEERERTSSLREEMLIEVKSILSEFTEKFKEIRTNENINITHAQCEIDKIGDNLTSMKAAFDDTEKKLAELIDKATIKETDSIADEVLEEEADAIIEATEE